MIEMSTGKAGNWPKDTPDEDGFVLTAIGGIPQVLVYSPNRFRGWAIVTIDKKLKTYHCSAISPKEVSWLQIQWLEVKNEQN